MEIRKYAVKLEKKLDDILVKSLLTKDNIATVYRKTYLAIRSSGHYEMTHAQRLTDRFTDIYKKQGFLKPTFSGGGEQFDRAVIQWTESLIGQMPARQLELFQRSMVQINIGASQGGLSYDEFAKIYTNSSEFKGLTFLDSAGRRQRFSTLVNRNVRGAMQDSVLNASNKIANELNTDVYAISEHADARELCALDQGKLFSPSGGTFTDLRGKKEKVYPWSGSSRGQLAGLFGINCRHVQFPMVEGLNINRRLDIYQIDV